MYFYGAETGALKTPVPKADFLVDRPNPLVDLKAAACLSLVSAGCVSLILMCGGITVPDVWKKFQSSMLSMSIPWWPGAAAGIQGDWKVAGLPDAAGTCHF